MWTYAFEHFLLKRQEKLCYKVVREYAEKLAERKNINSWSSLKFIIMKVVMLPYTSTLPEQLTCNKEIYIM